MKPTKKTTLLFGLAIACTALLGGWIVTRSHAAVDTTATKPAPDDELRRLLSARFDSATRALRIERAKLDNGKTTFETVYQVAQRALAAELELTPTVEGRVTALTKHIALMRQFEQEAIRRIEQGALAVGDDESPRYWRLTAEVELLRHKRAATATK